MSSKLETLLWIISILLPHLLLTILSLVSSKFKKWWIKWLVEKCLNKKERDEVINIYKKETKQIQFDVKGSIKLKNINNSTIILGSEVLQKERKIQEEKDYKSKSSEKSINSIAEKEVQSMVSKLTKKELKELIRKVKEKKDKN